MRWFKHMVASGQDEKLMLLKAEFGMAGYGAYWTILEHIAAQVTPENQQNFLEFPTKIWRKITEFSPKNWKNFIFFLKKVGLFEVQEKGDYTRITCRNILKYKDEYQRKNKKNDRKQNENVRTKSGATPEEETETDTEYKKDKDILINTVLDSARASVDQNLSTWRGEAAKKLRELGVTVTAIHPTLIAWQKQNFSIGDLAEAVEIARLSKPPPERIPANYLDAILKNQMRNDIRSNENAEIRQQGKSFSSRSARVSEKLDAIARGDENNSTAIEGEFISDANDE